MSLKQAKYANQYDFSGGINISDPGHLIMDNECFANTSTYDGTKNVYWDTGIVRRNGTLKLNTYSGIDLIDDGDCESTNNPILSWETTAQAVVNGTWARDGTQKYAGTYSWLLTKTSASGAGNAVAYFCDTNATNDMHDLKVSRTYYIEAYVYTDVATAANTRLVLEEYYSAGWHATYVSCATAGEFNKVSFTITTNAATAGIRIYLSIVSTEAVNKVAYIDELKIIDIADNLVNGIRFYRSSTPEKTTIVAANYSDEIKILYLDSNNEFIEITGGSPIINDQDVYFTKWKDQLYIANSDEVIQVISYSAGYSRADITGLTYQPQFIVHHRDRLWAAGGDMPVGYLECTAYESDSSWAAGNGEAFNVGYKDGDPITQLYPLGNNLIIYKNDSIWVMRGDNLFNWFQEREEPSVGCVAPLSVVDVGFGHIFLSKDNIYFFDGKNIAPIGNKIKPWLDAIPTSLRKKASATYFNSYYRLSYASSAGGLNDEELILDLKNFKQGKISWWLNDSRNIASYINYDGPDDDNTICFTDHNAGYIRQLDIGTQDDGVNIDTEFHSKYFTFDAPNTEKIYDRVKLDHALGVGNFTLDIIKNLNDAYILEYDIDASGTSSNNTFGTATLGTSYWLSQDKARLTTEVALPSEMDGYSISYKITHSGNYDNVSFYGLSLSYKYKGF